MGERSNLLSGEKSPYLRQHADNPVDWYPWGEVAFERARTEEKPVFLSIGYSTCHWCHVMAHESFEDERVAALLNEHFVCVKVDREERPDIDGVYMDAAVLMSGRGGWPLTIMMTADGKPFYAATYLPKESRFGMPGLMELLPRVAALWRDRRPELLDTAERVADALAGAGPAMAAQSALDAAGDDTAGEPDSAKPAAGRPIAAVEGPAVERGIAAAERELEARFDESHGGFGPAPKFPSPHNLIFLIRRWHRTGRSRLLQMVEKTLDEMRRGGIYDHVGFGFHRYSTDERWLVPHFEKMLYDQAMLTLAYTEAAWATCNPEYERTSREVIEYVLRDMTSPEGAFYSAEDADSEGVEGKFYLWATAELREMLGPDDGELAIDLFGATDAGNAREDLERANAVASSDRGAHEALGPNVLHLPRTLADVARERATSEGELRARCERIRETLYTVRQKRVRPLRDDKILTDWNALMISALSTAARVFDEPRYADSARKAADFMLARMRDENGRLLHRYCEGSAALPATADDYAFLVAALLELYDATMDTRLLSTAVELNSALVDRFWDDEGGGFFFTADDAEKLLLRKKVTHDGAVPSGNSVAVRNLVRLSRITGDADLEARASRLGIAVLPESASSPAAYTMFLSSLEYAMAPSREVVVAGVCEASETRALLRALSAAYDPDLTVLLNAPGDDGALQRVAPWTADMTPIDGRPAAYVCRDRRCSLPTTSPDELLDLLRQQ